MLVLSRGVDEKVIFPKLGVTVQILRIAGNKVRLGVRAPSKVRVLRHEIAEPEELAALALAEAAEPGSSGSVKLSHELRNRLNTANLAAHLAQKQIQAGLSLQAERTLQKALAEFRSLEESLAAERQRHTGVPARRRALLVEDNANESALLAGYLQMSGFDVDTVGDGVEAIDYLAEREKKPDVVLLDMQMPRLGGEETVSSIRCNPSLSGLKLFVVSGTDPSQVDLPVGPQGVDHWFHKPVDPRQLVDEIARRLRPAPVPA